MAVLDKRIHEVPGSAAAKPRFSARVPIVRGSRGGGAMGAIDLDRVAAYRAQAVVLPYSGDKPEGAEEVYRVEAVESR